MAKGFSIMDMMSDISRGEAAEGAETIEKVSVFDIQPNEDNFYEISSIEQLKNSIFSMGGVQQNLLLSRLPAGDRYKYKALAGHRRIYACIELVQEGHREFEHVPAVIKENIDKDTEDMLLIMTNSTQRELTDWEKVMQHMKLKEIIPKIKKRQGLDGKTRTLEADYLGVSEGQIAIYNTIGTKLDTWLMGVFKDGGIGISLAYEAARLEPEEQKQLVQITMDKGCFTEEDIKRLAGSRVIKGQQRIKENVSDSDTSGELADVADSNMAEVVNVSDSDTFKEPGQMKMSDTETQCDAGNKTVPPTDDEILCLYNHMIEEYDGNRKELANILKDNLGRSYSGFHCSEYDYQFSPKGVRINFSHYTTSYAELVRRLNTLVPEKENVPESGTFVEAQNEPVCAELTEKSEICYTNNAEEIGTAIDFIFFMNDFPEDKLNRLMDAFRRKENFTNASIAAELIFKEMLPYESRCIKVAYHAGYQVEYIQTGEIYCFPPYDFWKGFESGAGFCLDRNDIEQPEKAIENENVSDHDISEPDKLKVDKLPDISFRGGYTLAMVDKQIEKYGRYLSMAVEAGDIPNLVSEYSCLLDALELLRIGITMEDDDYEEGS